MSILLIILSIAFYLASIFLLLKKQLIAPIASFLGLLMMSLSETLPINNTMLTGWLCMTLIVMAATYMQPVAIQQQTRGMGYMTIGAFAGMTVGLVAFTVSSVPSLLNGFMILGTLAGTFFGYLLFTRTPDGRQVGIGTGNFFKYLLAKGFPTAITIMQIGIMLVVAIALNNPRL